MQYWFYVRIGGMTFTGDDGKMLTRYPLALVMTPMKHSTQGFPVAEVDEGREACDRAFALACWYSGVLDLMEEMVASKCWPLARKRPEMRIRW